MPDMMPVESSNIAAIGWEVDDHQAEDNETVDVGTLTIEFKNGRTYEYADVESYTWDDFKAAAEGAESVGQFFARRIRNGGYSYEQV